MSPQILGNKLMVPPDRFLFLSRGFGDIRLLVFSVMCAFVSLLTFATMCLQLAQQAKLEVVLAHRFYLFAAGAESGFHAIKKAGDGNRTRVASLEG